MAFVLDASGSMKLENWTKILSFTTDFIKRLDIGPDRVRVGVIVYSNDAKVEIPLGSISDKDKLIKQVESLKWLNSWTNTPYALELLRTDLFNTRMNRKDVDDFAVIVTDGQPETDTESPTVLGPRSIQEAQKGKDAGINMFVVGVGEKLKDTNSLPLLQAIASKPDQAYLTDFHLLYDTISKATSQLCTTSCKYYTLTHTHIHTYTHTHTQPCNSDL